jgi:lipid-binding SYLF domain-containing protein
MRVLVMTAALAVLGAMPVACSSDREYETDGTTMRDTALESRADAAVRRMKEHDPGISRFFDNSVGYAVFPDVGKGGFIVGGSHGDGVLYEHGMITKYVSLTAGSIGAQIGGEKFTEIIFFQSQNELNRFKEGRFELDAKATAVAVRAGGAASANYANGVAIFVTDQKGLMVDASVGGQKFDIDDVN